MKKVLIALDYNPTAQIVAESGFSMAESMGAETILLHVISEAIHYSSTLYSPIVGFTGYTKLSPLELNNIETLRKASEHYLQEMKQHLGNKNIHTLVREGNLAETILNAAKENQADIIVMGSHSQKWLENTLMGSVAEKVLKHTTLPLMIVPNKKTDK
jgi:nucleotide-binding universal stress UspA family protein